MAKLLKIGIVGCGAIGTSLAKAIVSDFSDKAVLSGLYDLNKKKIERLSVIIGKPKATVNTLKELIGRADLVIESASAACSLEIARKTIAAGKDIMVMSVGGLVNDYKKLEESARRRKVRIFIPSGAICGVDGLKASRESKIKKVVLTTRKPPRAFLGALYVVQKKINLDKINKDTVLFEGSALSAVKLFPQNINVAAVLSMAGLGAKKTIVRIIASPSISRNIHEIEVESEAGKIFTRSENIPHPENPKTSYLAVLSAVATLRQILNPMRIGN